MNTIDVNRRIGTKCDDASYSNKSRDYNYTASPNVKPIIGNLVVHREVDLRRSIIVVIIILKKQFINTVGVYSL